MKNITTRNKTPEHIEMLHECCVTAALRCCLVRPQPSHFWTCHSALDRAVTLKMDLMETFMNFNRSSDGQQSYLFATPQLARENGFHIVEPVFGVLETAINLPARHTSQRPAGHEVAR